MSSITRRAVLAGLPLVGACPAPSDRPGRTPSPPSWAPGRRPNIVWLMPDQWRADSIGAWGHPVIRTPNVDRLVAESVSFRNAYTVAPLCQPARVSFMSQRYPNANGTMDNVSEIDPSQPSHVRRMRDEAGYRCALIGKAHLTSETLHQSTDETLPQLLTWGFDEAVEVPGNRTTYTVENPYRQWLREMPVEGGTWEDRWIDWFANYEETAFRVREWETLPVSDPPWSMDDELCLDSFVGQTAAAWIHTAPEDRPFYLQVNFPGPHPPWNAPNRLAPYDPLDPRLPLGNRQDPGEPWSELVTLARTGAVPPKTELEHRLTVALYAQLVTHVDEALGLVLDALAETGRLEDTWIFTTSDHGEMLGEKNLLGKVVMFRQATNVPLIVRPPGGVAPWTSTAQVELVDLASTILEIGGLDPKKGERGKAITELVFATDDRPHRAEVVAENMNFGSVRTPEHLLVLDERTLEVAEYYDLVADPEELENRVAEPGTEGIRADLAELLLSRIS